MTYGKYPRELLGSKTNIGKTEKKGQYEPARIVTGLLIPFYSIKDYNCIHEA